LNLAGKVALVTGSSRGIGRAIALSLAQAGVNVAINYRAGASAAEETARDVRAAGRQTVAVQADVANASDVTRLVQHVQDALGPIDILVNNAGITRPQPVDEIREQDWDDLIDVNLKSCFLVTQAVLAGMRERRWGRIINLSSVAAQTGGVVGPHYAASKAGILGLTHFYASRYARDGITVNTIAPALIATEMVTSNPNARVDLIPIGRFGVVDEVADVALMLVKNAYITGQTINVNGGWYFS
jgi:3-oxoacyl-[acyl-carrier protein] reductase